MRFSVLGAIAIAATVTACTPSPQEPVTVAPSSSPSPSTTESPVTQSSSMSVASNGAGLGDTLQDIEAVHGLNAGDSDPIRYLNDELQVTYMDGRAETISLRFNTVQEPERSRSDAVLEAKPFLPSDAVQVKEWQEESWVYVIQYKSQRLADAYTENVRQQVWPNEGNKPGTFVLIVESDEGNPDSVVAVTITP